MLAIFWQVFQHFSDELRCFLRGQISHLAAKNIFWVKSGFKEGKWGKNADSFANKKLQLFRDFLALLVVFFRDFR